MKMTKSTMTKNSSNNKKKAKVYRELQSVQKLMANIIKKENIFQKLYLSQRSLKKELIQDYWKPLCSKR